MHDVGSHGAVQAPPGLAAAALAGPASAPWGPCTRCQGNWPFPMARQTAHSSYRPLFALPAKKAGCRLWGRGPKTKGSKPRGVGRSARRPAH